MAIHAEMARLVQRLQQLPNDSGLAQLGNKDLEPPGEVRLQLHRFFPKQLGFAKHRGGASIVASVEQIGEQALEHPKDLLPDIQVRIDLEQVEQDVKGAGSNVPLIFLLQLPSQVADL